MAASAPSDAAQKPLPDPSPPAVNPHRISMPFLLRLPLVSIVSGSAGFILGLTHGATEAGLRFRAENAHRLPKTQTGWYLYHKSKNYVALLGGIKEGFRMAGRLGLWTGVFVASEEGVDRARGGIRRVLGGLREDMHGEVKGGSKDFVSTVFAGLGTAGLFSAWNRFPIATAARMAKTGAKWGLFFGLLQDAVSMMRGRRLGYVEFIKRHTVGEKDLEDGGKRMTAVAG